MVTSAHPVFDVRIFHKEIKSLQNAGYAVSLIAQHHKKEIIDGLYIEGITPVKNRFLRFFWVMPKMTIAAFRQGADVYHFHDPDLLITGLLLKIFTRAKVIYDVHEDVPRQILSKEWLPCSTRKLVSVTFNYIEKKIAKTFDAVIAVAPSVAIQFKQKKVICVANYPKLEHFRPLMEEAERLPRSSVFLAIYAGGMERIRGLKEIVNSFGLLDEEPNIKLILAGPFSDKKFEKELQILKGWKKTEYLGFLAINDTYKKMMAANVGLICFLPEPNHINAKPNKMFEYMAAGLPVIASNFHLWKEIIEDGECGICINPKDPSDIANAIKFLANNPGKANTMGKNGRMAVKNKYNWAVEEKKLLFLYANL